MSKRLEQTGELETTGLAKIVAIVFTITVAFFSGSINGATPVFSKEQIDRAMGMPPLRLNDPAALSQINYPHGSIGTAVHYLALVAFLQPGATSSTGARVVDQVAAHLSNVVRAGNEPRFLGGMYSWVEHHLGAIIALASYTPAVWDRLTAADKERLEWLMKIGTYIGNLQHNAGNECYLSPGLWGVGGTNPNQANGMAAWMSYAFIYYGGADAVNRMLAAFDLDALINKATEFGWSFIRGWAIQPSTETLFTKGGYLTGADSFCRVQSKGVKAPFTFNGRIASGDPKCPDWTERPGAVTYEPFNIYKRSEYEWNLAAAVVDRACLASGNCGEAGHIRPGFTSPHLGGIGMFLEYNINGRSSPSYVSVGRKISVFHIATLMATGFWNSGVKDYDEVLERLATANDVYQYRELNSAWYDPDSCAFSTVDRKFEGQDFVDELWGAMVSPKVAGTYATITAVPAGPWPAPTNLEVN